MKKNTLKSLHIRNLLSFGDESPEIELGDLNVLIGSNGSGKSNLTEIIGLLRSTPKDFANEVGAGGGISNLLWKGRSRARSITASIQAVASPVGVKRPLLYWLSFAKAAGLLRSVDERIENEKPDEGHNQPYFYFDYQGGRPLLNVAGEQRSLRHEDVDPQKSILSQRQDPDQYPEVTYLGRFFGSFRLYRNWDFGPDSVVRDLYGAELKNDFWDEDISNLALTGTALANRRNRREPLVTVRSYVEGGFQGSTKSNCRQGFRLFFEKVIPRGSFRVIASGDRRAAFKDSCSALKQNQDDYIILLVDSEEAVTAGPWRHLGSREGDKWHRPAGAHDDQAHLIVQAMESWFLADRPALTDYYGQGFAVGSLPGQSNIELISKQDVFTALQQSSKKTQKGEYHKTRHEFELLERIDPNRVRTACQHADRLFVVRQRETAG
jgi:predicted ATPase